MPWPDPTWDEQQAQMSMLPDAQDNASMLPEDEWQRYMSMLEQPQQPPPAWEPQDPYADQQPQAAPQPAEEPQPPPESTVWAPPFDAATETEAALARREGVDQPLPMDTSAIEPDRDKIIDAPAELHVGRLSAPETDELRQLTRDAFSGALSADGVQRLAELRKRAGEGGMPAVPDFSGASSEQLADYQVRQQQADEQVKQRLVAAKDAERAEAEAQAMRHQRKIAERADARTEQLFASLEELRTREPRDVWADKSMPTKLAFIVSAMIDGWLKPGGKNNAIAAMQHLMEQNAQQQRAKAEQDRLLLGQEVGLVGKLRAAGESDYTATMASIAAGYGQAMKEIDNQIASLHPGTSAAMNAEMAKRAVAAQKAKAEEEIRKQHMKESLDMGELEVKQENARTQRFAAEAKAKDDAAGRAIDWAKLAFEKQKEGKVAPPTAETVTDIADALGVADKDRGRMVIYAHREGHLPKVFLANTPEQAAALNTMIPATNILVDRLTQMHRLVDEHGHEFNNPLYRSQYGSLMDAINKQTILLMKDTENMGALQAGEIKLLKDMAGDSPSLLGHDKAGLLRAIESTRAHYIQRMNQNFQSAGAVDPRTLNRISYSPRFTDNWKTSAVDTSAQVLKLKAAKASGREGAEQEALGMLVKTIRERGADNEVHQKQLAEALALYKPEDTVFIDGKLVNAREYITDTLQVERGKLAAKRAEEQKARQEDKDREQKYWEGVKARGKAGTERLRKMTGQE